MEKIEVKFMGIAPESPKPGKFTTVFGSTDYKTIELLVGEDQAKEIYAGIYGVNDKMSEALDEVFHFFKEKNMSFKEVIFDDLKGGITIQVMVKPDDDTEERALITCGTVSSGIAFAKKYNLPIYVTDVVMNAAAIDIAAGQKADRRYQPENQAALKKILADIENKLAEAEKYELAGVVRDKIKSL